VATAAGLCFASLGSDTGGSIRFPSACCGLVGIKPTYGRVPRSGIVPLADSLDHVGPMTRSVEDAAIVLRTIAGHDPRDATSLPQPVPDYTAELGQDLKGVRIGVDEGYSTDGVAPEVASAVASATEVLAGLGAELCEVRMPPTGHLANAAWIPLLAVEAARAHAKHFPARADEYGPTVRALIELGHATSAEGYAAAHLERLAFSARLSGLFEEVDLLACPAIPFPPPPAALFGNMNLDANAPLEILRFTAPHDLSGSPTLTLPCGFTDGGLPLALQLVARHLGEPLLCRAGHAYEQATEWHLRHPELS
jgi:amidase